MQNTSIVRLTRTALFIALVVLAQFIGTYFPGSSILIGPIRLGQIITGSLVNMTLIVSVPFCGLAGSVSVGVISSVLATLLGMNLPLPQMLPIVAIGNVVIVTIMWFFFKKATTDNIFSFKIAFAGILVGSILKASFLWVGVAFIIIPLFTPSPQLATVLLLNFSWPQLITATLGGILALSLIRPLKKAFSN